VKSTWQTFAASAPKLAASIKRAAKAAKTVKYLSF